MRIPNDNENALLNFLCCEQTELKKHTPTVYEWRGFYLEVLKKDQMLRSKTPASWYMTWGHWRIREMGKQAEKVKKIKKIKNKYA